ncbi:hypothetical protein ACJRO7_033378 [Eucalyptus globulus]|uniref:Uncharacterized protein n=1 Tax=Eucalyptus globulus TaxID=34317 RepID=A0ABD3JQ59_EUCGL
MSSIGATSAHVYVMKKRQEEKLKKMEKEGAKSVGEDKAGGDSNDYNDNSGFAGNKKVHPHSSPASSFGKTEGS